MGYIVVDNCGTNKDYYYSCQSKQLNEVVSKNIPHYVTTIDKAYVFKYKKEANLFVKMYGGKVVKA